MPWLFERWASELKIMIHQLAYLDPGTGSFLLQMLAGGLFGGLFMLKRFFRQAKNAIVTPKAQRDLE